MRIPPPIIDSPLLPKKAAVSGTIRLTPPISAASKVPLVQTIELLEADGTLLATAMWFTTGSDGVIQLLHAEVDADHRRRGIGTRLHAVLLKEANLFFRTRGTRLRRVLVNAEQKNQIVARAWLTHLGFHHVQTITNSLKGQDILVYALGCD